MATAKCKKSPELLEGLEASEPANETVKVFRRSRVSEWNGIEAYEPRRANARRVLQLACGFLQHMDAELELGAHKPEASHEDSCHAIH